MFNVVVDLKPNSTTFGKHIKIIVYKENRKPVFISKDITHGFLVVNPEDTFSYKCDAYYNNAVGGGINFGNPILLLLKNFLHGAYFGYRGKRPIEYAFVEDTVWLSRLKI